MNSFKTLALFGVAATSVTAHRHGKHGKNELLQQKTQFIADCSEDIIMCEDIIARTTPFVIVDPTEGSDSQNSDSVSNPSDLVRQCVADSLRLCMPALESREPATLVHCVVEHRHEIVDNLKKMSPECQQVFRDLLIHHRRHRHGGHGDYDDDKDDDDDSNHQAMRLTAPGADIGACLLSNTQNLTATCLSAVESVNATDAAAWAFLDAEPVMQNGHVWRRYGKIAGGLLLMTALMCCCYVRAKKRRNAGGDCSRGHCSRGSSGAAPAPLSINNTLVQTAYPTEAVEDPDLARAIAASIADSRVAAPRVTPTAPPATYTPPRAVDVAYTGASNREPFIKAGAIHSDQYV